MCWGGKGSGQAEGAGIRGQSAHRRGEAVVGGVCEGEQEEDEEDHTQEVRAEDREALRVLQGRADGRKAHVVTE